MQIIFQKNEGEGGGIFNRIINYFIVTRTTPLVLIDFIREELFSFVADKELIIIGRSVG